MPTKELSDVLLDRLPSVFIAAQAGDSHAALVAMRRFVAQLRAVAPELAEELNGRTFRNVGALAIDPLRRSTPSPIDSDSQASLLRRIDASAVNAPVLDDVAMATLVGLVAEHRAADKLALAALSPRSTVLFTGPPGVGKTMAAKWLARELGFPLVQVELSATVSSYLGRTGQNIREVLDFARTQRVVLLLDEFDAIAKRRDDHSDLGELKRTVSVLLKEIEDWHGPSVLVAATNHPALIDPAIFRRFQVAIEFGLPSAESAQRILRQHLDPIVASPPVLALAAELLAGESGSSLRELAHDIRRAAVMADRADIDGGLLRRVGSRAQSVQQRRTFCRLARAALPESQRSFAQLAEMLGVSKATVHNYLK